MAKGIAANKWASMDAKNCANAFTSGGKSNANQATLPPSSQFQRRFENNV